MLDHEEKFLFKEEILHLSNAVGEPGVLDNVEDLLTDVITSPRPHSAGFTLERPPHAAPRARAGAAGEGAPPRVIASPRCDWGVFPRERSLQVMLGARAGTTLVGLLTVSPE